MATKKPSLTGKPGAQPGNTMRLNGNRGRLITDALVRALFREMPDEKGVMVPKKRFFDMIEHIADKAASGDIVAIKEVYDRLEGKPVTPMEHSGEIGQKQVDLTPVEDLRAQIRGAYASGRALGTILARSEAVVDVPDAPAAS